MYARPDDLAVELQRSRFDPKEQARAERCLNAATSQLDAWLFGSSLPPDPRVGPGGEEWSDADRAAVKTAVLGIAVELWKQADAAFGAIGFSDIGVLRAPREAFVRYGLQVAYLKTCGGWGIA